jgi:hypothetical protein
MNVPSTSPVKGASCALLVYAGKNKVRYFLNTPHISAWRTMGGYSHGKGLKSHLTSSVGLAIKLEGDSDFLELRSWWRFLHWHRL